MTDAPHDIVIVIPVADRPRHLSDCLNSLLELNRRYPYAGKVSVLVAEDSLAADSAAQHRAITEAITRQGLETHYLGQDAQRALVEALPGDVRTCLSGVIGDGASYAHKGASITRNIAYLWLNRLQSDGRRRLFWFIDSDQEFRVNVKTPAGEEQVYAIDYCNALDRIFNTTSTQVLTGKVVGDPPVSPAVMAGNFLDDVSTFLHDMAQRPPQAACTFHDAARHADDAAYHDMAELFGFKAAEAFRYHCALPGPHDHARCFADFAGKLGRFFDGEHPTRRSVYQPDDLVAGIRPARTIYTGNYVFSAAGLDYFIPFAALKLRMAGPTLGRIIKAELGAHFVSANLPMLHKRTVAAIGQSEFRPGVERSSERVDLSGEFERQYFGDVMLFSMERLSGAVNGEAGCVPRTEPRIKGEMVRSAHPATAVSQSGVGDDAVTVGCAPRTEPRIEAELVRSAHPTTAMPQSSVGDDAVMVGCAPRTDSGDEIQAVRDAHPAMLELVCATVAEVDAQMLDRYALKHRQIAEKIAQLRARFDDITQWWQQDARLVDARALFRQFIDNMQHNFGDESRAWQIINDTDHRQARRAAIAEAIVRYREDRKVWRSLLAADGEGRVAGK